MLNEYRPTVPHDPQELRARAVKSVLDGAKKVDVARDYGITRQTLHNWVTRHRLGGPDGLVARRAGRTRHAVLEPWQEGQVEDAIRNQPPWTVQPGVSRWTKQIVARYIEQRFGVRLSTWQVDSHLRRWGFGSHKEARRAFLSVQDCAGATGRISRERMSDLTRAAAGRQQAAVENIAWVNQWDNNPIGKGAAR